MFLREGGSAESIPTPKNRESIPCGFLGQGIIKLNRFITIKNIFFSNESHTIRSIWGSTQYYVDGSSPSLGGENGQC